MKAVIQRVKNAEVIVDGTSVAQINRGILTLLGIARGDTETETQKLIKKICELRIFEDETGKMNLSLLDIHGEHLIVSQFTLAADCNTGRRPSFTIAERPEQAQLLYGRAVALSRELGISTASGIFQANMQISLINDGPATFVLEAKAQC